LEVATGSQVILHGRTKTESLEKLSLELDAPMFTCDGQDAAAVNRTVDQIAEQGYEIDALICTVGAVLQTDALSGDTERWIDEYRSNVLAPVNFIRAVAPGMISRGRGRIVTVSSIRGRDNLASPEVTGYSAAKAALENVTVSFAKALAPSITVNAVAPGFVMTDMADTWSEKVKEEVAANLLGRAGQPEEIAALLSFLASDGASFITGQTILADGGLDAR